MAGSRGVRVVKAMVLFLLIATSAAWSDEQSSARKNGSTATTQVSLDQSRQKLEQQQAQVRQLQGTVAKQQSDSKQTRDRMERQDQIIAQMQQQWQELHTKSATRHR